MSKAKFIFSGKIYNTFSVDSTNKSSYKLVLKELREQAIFSNLCDLVTNLDLNSFTYNSMDELCVKVGESNRSRLSKLIKKFMSLGLLVQKNKQIYINPQIFKRTNNLDEFVLKLFKCAYKKPNKNNNTKEPQSKVTRNIVDKSQLVDIEF